MVNLAHTSVPPWAVPGGSPAPPATASGIHVSVGNASHDGADIETASRWLTDTLAQAKVGVRVRISGAVGECLKLRAVAVSAGVEDDEFIIEPTGHATISVRCVHCGQVTDAETGIEQVIPCEACGRKLFVYYHVSRRTGLFLGYQADAEEYSG